MRKAWNKLWEAEEATIGRLFTLQNLRRNAGYLAVAVVAGEVMHRHTEARMRRADREHIAAAIAERQRPDMALELPQERSESSPQYEVTTNSGATDER